MTASRPLSFLLMLLGLLCVLTTAPARASSPRMRRASPSRVSPWAVVTTWRPDLSSSGQPSCCSRRRICWLMVDWVRCIRSPARVKLPVSTMATKLCSRWGSSKGRSMGGLHL